jgi:hypothetical protein
MHDPRAKKASAGLFSKIERHLEMIRALPLDIADDTEYSAVSAPS